MDLGTKEEEGGNIGRTPTGGVTSSDGHYEGWPRRKNTYIEETEEGREETDDEDGRRFPKSPSKRSGYRHGGTSGWEAINMLAVT